jgi:hypothetical protein
MDLRKQFCFSSIILFVCSSLFAQTQAQNAELSAADDTNPTKPVFLSIRQEYYNQLSERWTNLFMVRTDKVVLKDTQTLRPKGIILRVDLPISSSHVSNNTEIGLGDVYAQGLFFPRLRKTFTFAAGTGFFFPTATDSILGQGKWQAAPLAIPIWIFPQSRGFFLTKFQDVISFAGNGTRPEIHYHLITPTLMWRYSPKSWILLDTEAKINWRLDNRTSYRSGVQFGKMFNRKFGLWVKPEFPWGEHREADWFLKFAVILAK